MTVLLSPELTSLLTAAKLYIASLSGDQQPAARPTDQSVETSAIPALALKRFKFLSTKIMNNDASAAATSPDSSNTILSQLNKYMADVVNTDVVHTDALNFWGNRRLTYDNLAPIAEDLLVAPASQAYVERIFSVCGMLTTGRHNRMHKSLEMRVFLKLNKHI